MVYRSGVRHEVITFSAEQASRHQLPAVSAALLPGLGDGYILNQTENGYLSGALVRRRNREGRWIHEVGGLDSGLIQIDMVGNNLQASINSLTGYYDESGEWITGELERVEERRRELPYWFDLSKSERQIISEFYGATALSRTFVRHPTQLSAWASAARAEDITRHAVSQEFLDDRATKLTEQLEAALSVRANELSAQQRINFQRRIRFNRWFLHENRQLSVADRLLSELVSGPDKEMLQQLRQTARQIHFRVQPFNQLASEILETAGNPDTAEAFERTRAGLQFERLYLYLTKPFNILAGKRATMSKLKVADLDPLLASISERQMLLENMRAIGGPYRTLVDKVLDDSGLMVTSIHNRRYKAAKILASSLTWRLDRHCLPGEPAMSDWYTYRL